MSDQVELHNNLVPLVFPASLLYFVSGVLEDNRDEPLLGMERYYLPRYTSEPFRTIKTVKEFKGLTGSHAYAWAQVAGFDGANCDMISHGGWIDALSTLQSVLFLVRKGCGNEWQ